MARTVCIHPDEVLKAKQLRDQASTVAEYRKALSVLLVAEHGFDADRVADALASVAARFFAIEIKFSVKMTCAKIPRAVAGMHP